MMSQLSKPIIGEPEWMVAEGTVQIEISESGDTDFQLILSPIVGDNLPVVNTICHRCVGKNSSENVGLLFKENTKASSCDLNSLSTFGTIPFESSL